MSNLEYIQKGSFFRLLLFIIVMQALSCHIVQAGCPWELLYVDDLVIIAETLDELLEKFVSGKPT